MALDKKLTTEAQRRRGDEAHPRPGLGDEWVRSPARLHARAAPTHRPPSRIARRPPRCGGPGPTNRISLRLRVSVVHVLNPQIFDGDIAMELHAAGEALVGGGAEPLQEVPFLRIRRAAGFEAARDADAAGAAGSGAAAEGDVGAH